MGTLGDNLLKLTEFPFSYSLIGLLALIFGEGLNLEEASIATLGPLLILMGFVATVLSITDPIGALQKRWLSQSVTYGSFFSQFTSKIKSRFRSRLTKPVYQPDTYPEYPWTYREDGTKRTSEELEAANLEFWKKWMGWILLSPTYPKLPSIYRKDGTKRTKRTSEELEALRRRYKEKLLYFLVRHVIFGISSAFGIHWTVLICLIRNFQGLFGKNVFRRATLELREISTFIGSEETSSILNALLSFEESQDLAQKIGSIRRQTLGTTWILREIDKITAMAYFAIIISTFISAEFLIGDFLDKFLVSFQGGNQTEDVGQNATMGTNGAASSTIVIPGADILARITIIVFSFSALGAVLYMLYRRLSELRSKAWTTFTFLVALDAVKIENERFNPSLKDIERYLSNGDWTMARYWVERVMDEYDQLIRDRAA